MTASVRKSVFCCLWQRPLRFPETLKIPIIPALNLSFPEVINV